MGAGDVFLRLVQQHATFQALCFYFLKEPSLGFVAFEVIELCVKDL